MTSNELEDYKAEIINKIQYVQKIHVLDSIKKILEKDALKARTMQRKVQKALEKVAKKKYIDESEPTIFPCCYTIDEVRKNIFKEIEAYAQGKYITEPNLTKIVLRWSESAFYDVQTIQKFSRLHYDRYPISIESVFDALLFNTKAGRRDKLFADILDGNIRSLHLNKRCKMYYTIITDCIYVLAIQNGTAKLK